MNIHVGIITISDRASQGLYDDLGGPALKKAVEGYGWKDRPIAQEQLYDLIFDPGEASNVADDPSLAAVRDEMRTRLDQPDSLVILKKPFDNVEVQQLAHAMTKKWLLSQQARLQLSELERLVQERTRELQNANRSLTLSASC